MYHQQRKGKQSIADAAEELKAKLRQKYPDLDKISPEEYKPVAPKPVCSPDCPLCDGGGWVRSDYPVGHEKFGMLEPCPNLDASRLRSAGEGKNGLRWDEERGMNWSAVLPVNGAPAAVRIVRNVLAAGYGMVYLHGGPGQAKSLILKVAIAESLRAGNAAAYSRLIDIFDNIKDAFGDDVRESAAQRVNRWSNVPILAIDELDKVNRTDWVSERLFQLLDTRYNDALYQHTITLIASNEPPEALDPYLASRIRDARFDVVHLFGKDMRPRMAKDQRW